MTTVFFLRHGETLENQEGRMYGQRPGKLLLPETEHYIAAVVPLLRGERINVLLSSDLRRAVETRRILRKFLQIPGLEEGSTSLLREISLGFYEGLLWSQVSEGLQEDRKRGIFDFRKFGGENNDDVQARVAGALAEFAKKYINKRICCITHAVWLRELADLAAGEGAMPDKWNDRSAIYRCEVGPKGQIVSLNSVDIKARVEN